jgi:hypothetical protein
LEASKFQSNFYAIETQMNITAIDACYLKVAALSNDLFLSAVVNCNIV